MNYDYSKIKEYSLIWEYEHRDYITIKTKPLGLVYLGDLQIGPYAGGYTAGFQTYNDFLKNKPLYNMPATMKEKMYNYIKKNRKQDGYGLKMYLNITSKNYFLYNSDFGIGKIHIHSDYKRPADEVQRTGIFNGSCPKGKHYLKSAVILNNSGNNHFIIYLDFRFLIESEKSNIIEIKINGNEKNSMSCSVLMNKENIDISNLEIL